MIVLFRVSGWVLAVCFLCVGSLQGFANDHVRTSGVLSDESFYRLVACGAKPDRPCQHAMVRWPVGRLSVGIVDVDASLSETRLGMAKAALRHAVDQVNQSGAGLKLRIDGRAPDIEVFLSASGHVRNHSALNGLQRNIGRRPIGATRIFFQDYRIQRAVVVIASGMGRDVLTSVMLEEVTQALGLPTDIQNRHYRGRSIFSEGGNRMTTLGAQDARALQRHYPRR